MSNSEIEKLEDDLADAKARHEKRDLFPKWVVPHDSHLVKKSSGDAPDHVSAPGYPDVHVGRDGVVTVLVHDEADEARAVAEVVKPEPKEEVKEEPKEELKPAAE